VSQSIKRHAEGADIFSARHALLDGSIDRAIIDQRAAGSVYKCARSIFVPGAQFGDLAGRASDRSLVALRTGLGVVDRSQSLFDGVTFLEDQPIIVVGR